MVEENLTKNSLNEIYKKISSVVPEIEWKFHAPLIQKIKKDQMGESGLSFYLTRSFDS